MKLNLKTFLIGITVIAVVSDSMLIPFYPQFFAAVFNVTDPQYVGNYIAATCLVVMLAFPCWARVAKTIAPLHLLIYTQLAAGILSVMCFWTTSLWAFWTVSLAMLAFKGSYLLVYPFVMSLEDSSRHGGTIGLLSVIVHFGAILGALLGGIVLQLLEPRQAFLIMAVGDFLQTLVCILLVRQERSENPQPAGAGDPQLSGGETVSHGNRRFIVKLSLVMLVFYFCAYLIRPFFSVYWESISAFKGEIAAGMVFAIPALMALLALWSNHKRKTGEETFDGILSALLIGSCGLLLQGTQQELIVLAGRCLFGWALFQSTVRLDLLVFRLSTPESYATDFSKIHFFQSLGVLLASHAAGSLVSSYGLPLPFFTAAFGFVVTLVLYLFLFKPERESARAALQVS